MPCRNDAGLAGAELALEVERITLSTGSVDTVGTTGVFEITPGAVNSVPREARLGIGEWRRASEYRESHCDGDPAPCIPPL